MNKQNLNLSFRYFLSRIPKPIKKKVKNAVPTTLAIFLTIFFLIFAIKPTILTIVELVAEIKIRRQIEKDLQEKLNQIMAAQKEYNQIYDKLYLADQALPSNPEFASFARHLEGERSLANLQLNNLNYSQIILTKKKNDKINDDGFIGFSTSLEGQFFDIKMFLQRLFDQRRITYIDGLKIWQVVKENKSKNLQVNLEGKTFYFTND